MTDQFKRKMPYKDKIVQLEAQKQHYENNKIDYLNRNNNRRIIRRKWLKDYLENKCCIKCGETAKECLDFHHIDPKSKKSQISKMLNEFRSMKEILFEINKCVILCSNCHRKYHAGTINL